MSLAVSQALLAQGAAAGFQGPEIQRLGLARPVQGRACACQQEHGLERIGVALAPGTQQDLHRLLCERLDLG